MVCMVCALLFQEQLVMLVCTRFGEVSPKDPCVVCHVQNKQSMHGRLVVECKQCKKRTCLKCRKKLTRLDCPACRSPLELCHATRS